MANNQRLNVAICWQLQLPRAHSHNAGRDHPPWLLLRAIGVYTDMLAELEQATNARAVLLLSPDLIELVEELARQVRQYIASGRPLHQPLLAALVNGAVSANRNCGQLATRATRSRSPPARHRHGATSTGLVAAGLQRQPEFARHPKEPSAHDHMVRYLLHWLAISVLRHDPRARHLAEQVEHFSLEERLGLLTVIGEQLGALLPRLRDLAREGRVEPGLLSASRRPDQVGGELRRLQSQCGRAPSGYWRVGRGLGTPPPNNGIIWVGGNPAGLQRKLPAHNGRTTADTVYYYPRPDGQTKRACLRREELLSRMIERSYPDWQAEDAVANCTWRLQEIARRCATRSGALVVLAIGDRGVWDRYPDRGSAFRRALYQRIGSHPNLRLTTLDRALSASANPIS